MLRLPRRMRRRFLTLVIAWLVFLTILNLGYAVLPLDSPLRLAFTFNAARAWNSFRGASSDRDAWLKAPARFPVDLGTDVAYLIKTGYGTRHRVPEQLAAFGKESSSVGGKDGSGLIVVGDWTTVNATDAAMVGIEVHDAIKTVIETVAGGTQGESPRFLKYKSLQSAIASGDEDEALEIGQNFGWELDALKFVAGMELLYRTMPDRKWYIILDDDTFLVRQSLQPLLSHLDPTKPYYIGNAVGDFRVRFAHGGSGIVMSGATMGRLFGRPNIVARAYADSLYETWGDRLVATTLQRVGVYMDERYSHHFSGQSPLTARVSSDRFCSPIVSFHNLRKPGSMTRASAILDNIDGPVLWGDVWDLFAGTSIQALAARPVRQRQDHVGELAQGAKTWEKVPTAEDCKKKCHRSNAWCVAWTHDTLTQRCHASPWLIVGDDQVHKKASGVNWRKVQRIMQDCR